MKVKLLSRVRLSDPMDCSLTGSSVHGIFQARVLEWGAIVVKNPHGNAGDSRDDAGLILGLRRSFGVRSDNLLQYSCLGNPMDRRALWATAYGVAKELDMT